MFGSVGFFEMAVIAGVALMVLGPEKFPEYAKIAMRGFRDVRKYMTEAQREITKELNPLKDELDEITRMNPESYLDDILKEEEEDYDDDSPLNPEPHPDDIDWMSDPYGSSGAEDADHEHSAVANSTSDGSENDGGESSEQNATEEPVQYNLYGGESEGADPDGAYDAAAEQAEDFDITGGFTTTTEDTDIPDEEKPLDG
jgi:sec-independent protein translocase protein TatB